MNDDEFIEAMGHFLKKEKIDFDIVLALSRSISTAEELIMPEEITPIIRVNLSEPIYLYNINLHSHPGYISHYFEGSESLLLKLNDKYKMDKIEPFKLPISTIEQNQSVTKLAVAFEDDQFNQLKINRQVTHSGYNKRDEQFDLLSIDDAVQEDYKYFDETSYINRVKMKKKTKNKIIPKLKAISENYKKEQKEAFKKSAMNDFDLPIESYETYTILEQGRQSFDDPMIFKDQFQIENLTKRAGKNYLFEVGKLIGGQVAIADDEQQRDQDIFMPYPRAFLNEISIEIPAGYSVEGLEKLNIDVQNGTGGFVTTAKMNGQQLVLTTHKFYNHQFEKAAQWSDMTAFLEAAYDYTQTKVLLKKQ